MINIKVQDVDGLYKAFRDCSRIGVWKEFDCDHYTLPSPLKTHSVSFRSNGESFSGSSKMYVSGRMKNSELVSFVLNQAQGFEYLKGGDSDLYLLKEGQSNYFIHAYANAFLEIKFGDKGTKLKEITTVEQFKDDIVEFSDLFTRTANGFVSLSGDIQYFLNLRPDTGTIIERMIPFMDMTDEFIENFVKGSIVSMKSKMRRHSNNGYLDGLDDGLLLVKDSIIPETVELSILGLRRSENGNNSGDYLDAYEKGLRTTIDVLKTNITRSPISLLR